MSSYGQFCPLSKSMEVLDERWTLLVVRELLLGSTHFNELRRGNPKMSPALLSKRLRTLERAGIVRRTVESGRSSYTLTPCGQELGPVVKALSVWGTRWIGELGEQDLDPHLLMWDLHRTIPLAAWPRGRTVVAFEFHDVAPRVGRWWLCVTGDDADVCDYDPGFEVTATVSTSLRTMIEIWRGDRGWGPTLRAGMVTIAGSRTTTREVPTWLGQMSTAEVARPEAALTDSKT